VEEKEKEKQQRFIVDDQRTHESTKASTDARVT
jgi:hypothetical protein